jgi:hypothetical protein
MNSKKKKKFKFNEKMIIKIMVWISFKNMNKKIIKQTTKLEKHSNGNRMKTKLK